MRENAQSAQVKIAHALALLVKEEVVQAPDGAFFAVERIVLRHIAVSLALAEVHLLVNDSPHPRAPNFIPDTVSDRSGAGDGGWRKVLLVRDKTAVTRAQVVQSRVDVVHERA